MTIVVRTGARVALDAEGTDSYCLSVRVGVFADLEDGRRIVGGPAWYAGPRRGLGAVWVRYEGDGSELPHFDRDLFERDPDEAITQALVHGYRLRDKDIEDIVRLHLFEGGFPAAGREDGGELDPEEHRRDNERTRDANWGDLIASRRAGGVDVTPQGLAALPFQVDFEESVIRELAS